VDVVIDSLRPVPSLSLTFDVMRIAEEVAAADGEVHSSELQTVTLIRLVTIRLPEPRPVGPPRRSRRSQ
jgi:hypothetical protein